jgi:adenylate kinase family enzyme
MKYYGEGSNPLPTILINVKPCKLLFKGKIANMKTIILGNAGSGKTTLSRKLIEIEPASRLSLDDVAFDGSADRCPIDDSIAKVMGFIATRNSWVIEGCYADILEPIMKYADKLIFLNPEIKACIQHCKNRPWEPEKFKTKEEQDANLNNLIDWVTEYQTRSDEYGLKRHRQIFNNFSNEKIEYTHSSQYAD